MASLLEKFYILITADTKEVSTSTKDAKKHTDDLARSLTNTDALSRKVSGGLNQAALSIGKMVAAYLSVTAVLKGFGNALENADKLGKLSDALGVNTEDLDAWGRAVKFNGGSAEEFQSTAKSLTAAIADIATKGTSRLTPFFNELGISVLDSSGKAKSFLTLLPEISDSFQKLSQSEAFGIGQKMGLDLGTIVLLRQGRMAIDDLIRKQKELGTVTKEQAKIAADFNDAWDYLRIAFNQTYTVINTTILPVLTVFLRQITDVFSFLKANPKLVQGALIALGTAIAVFLVPPLITAATSAIALYAPILAVIGVVSAAAAAFALLYDDIQHFLEGNKSVIGYLSEKWPPLRGIVLGIVDAFKILRDVGVWVGEFLVNMFVNPMKAWQMFVDFSTTSVNAILGLLPNLTGFASNVGDAFEGMANWVLSIWEKIVAVIQGAIGTIRGAIDSVAGAYGRVKNFFGFGGEETKETAQAIGAGQGALAVAGNAPLNSQTSNSIISNNRAVNKTTSVTTGDINIQTQATSSQQIAGSISDDLTNQIQYAINNFDDGVRI